MNRLAQEDSETGPDGRDSLAEQRRDPRFIPIIRTAKLICDAGEFLCLLRDISASGVHMQLFHSLPASRDFTLELPNGESFAMERVWERAGHAGFQFRGLIEPEKLIGDSGPYRRRPVRLELYLPATISSHAINAGVVVRNLSQQGARIESPIRLAIDQKLQLAADLLPKIQARVRWRRQADHGLVFDQTFRFDELARLVARLQLGAGTKPAPQLERLHFV